MGDEGTAPHFLSSELSGGEWLAPRPRHFIPRGYSPRYLSYMRLSGPSEYVWALWRREQSFALTGNRTLTPRLSSP
jgi:hypothetical protein